MLFHTSRTVLKFGKLKALSVSAKLELRKKKKMEMPLAGLAFRSWPRRNKMCFEFHDLRWPVSDCNPTPEASHNFGAAFKLISAEGAGSAPERGWGYPQPRFDSDSQFCSQTHDSEVSSDCSVAWRVVAAARVVVAIGDTMKHVIQNSLKHSEKTSKNLSQVSLMALSAYCGVWVGT